MSRKLILVSTEEHYCEGADDYGSYDPEVTVQEVSLVDLIGNYETQGEVAALIRKAIEEKNEFVLNLLASLGWVDKKAIQDREEKLVAGKKFYYIDRRRNSWGSPSEVDVTRMRENTIRALADENVQIVQAMTKPSLKKLFTAKQKKVYDAEVARLKREKAKRAEAAKKRAEKKKAKEIEKAKKILEQAGE